MAAGVDRQAPPKSNNRITPDMNAKINKLKVGAAVALVLSAVIIAVIPCHAAPTHSSSTTPTNVVNYTIRVEWQEHHGSSHFIQLVTTEGQFQLNTSQSGDVEVNNTKVPVTINLNGDLKAVSSTQAQLSFFLGRTVPYVTKTAGSAGKSSTYQQRQEGISSKFVVTFGKPLVVQKDSNGEVSVLVKREEP